MKRQRVFERRFGEGAAEEEVVEEEEEEEEVEEEERGEEEGLVLCLVEDEGMGTASLAEDCQRLCGYLGGRASWSRSWRRGTTHLLLATPGILRERRHLPLLYALAELSPEEEGRRGRKGRGRRRGEEEAPEEGRRQRADGKGRNARKDQDGTKAHDDEDQHGHTGGHWHDGSNHAHNSSSGVSLVGPQWLFACLAVLPQPLLLSPTPYACSDPLLDAARLSASSLFAGNVFIFAGQMEEMLVGASAGERASLRKSGTLVKQQIHLHKGDLVVLAALHGAVVLDSGGLPNALPFGRLEWNGYTMGHLLARQKQLPGVAPQYRVILPSRDAVSKLGLEIYLAALNVRPLLVDWVVASIQAQRLADVEPYEMYA